MMLQVTLAEIRLAGGLDDGRPNVPLKAVVEDDLFGILVLSFVAGNFGGITRDVLIGSVPPAAISDWRYLAVSLLAGVITFYSY